MGLKKEEEECKCFVSLRNIKLSVVCSKILTTSKLNFVNRLGISLLPGENKEEKKDNKRRPLPSPTHIQMHPHMTCVHHLTL